MDYIILARSQYMINWSYIALFLLVFIGFGFLIWKYIQYPQIKKWNPDVKVTDYFSFAYLTGKIQKDWRTRLAAESRAESAAKKKSRPQYPLYIRVIPLLLILILLVLLFN